MNKLFIGLIILFIIQILFSCNSELPSSYSNYSFSKIQLEKGIVNKYYLSHIYQTQTNRGSVNYKSYKLLENDTLLSKSYNAAKEVTSQLKYLLSSEGKLLLDREDYLRRDTVSKRIDFAEPFRWEEGRTSQRDLSHNYNDYSVSLSINDSIGKEVEYLNIPSREVHYKVKRIVHHQGEFSDSSEWNEKSLFAKNIGLFSYEYETEERTSRMELIEQMSLSDFEKIEIPYIKRIAYIDPDKSWSPEGFEVCTNRINDYYNWETPELYGGKKELEDFVLDRYDSKSYKDQSGYLSIHFVINCKGETGRFIDRSHNLDFEVDSFSPQIKDHLMSILKEKKGWIPQVNNYTNEKADVYHYVTFRIENGKIDEILP